MLLLLLVSSTDSQNLQCIRKFDFSALQVSQSKGVQMQNMVQLNLEHPRLQYIDASFIDHHRPLHSPSLFPAGPSANAIISDPQSIARP